MRQIISALFLLILVALSSCQRQHPAETGIEVSIPISTSTIISSKASSTLPPEPIKTFSPTPSPTGSPTLRPTATHVPTLPKATPAVNTTKYQLAVWSNQDASNAIDLLNQQAFEIEKENGDNVQYGALNPLRKHVALLAEEILWQYPGIEDPDSVMWDIAQNYAQAGDQKATNYFARLIEEELNVAKPIDPSVVKLLPSTDFAYSWSLAPNLFHDAANGWVLTVTKKPHDDINGGSVLAIRRTSNDGYRVLPISSTWLPYLGSEFSISIGDHTGESIPEVIVRQSQQHGVGYEMTESWICAYQWAQNHWQALLANVPNDPRAVYGVTLPLGSSCFVIRGDLGEVEYVRNQNNNLPSLIVSRTIRPGSICAWDMKHIFTWTGGYHEQAQVKVPPKLRELGEMACFGEIWPWINIVQNKSDVIDLMETTLSDWPLPDTPLGMGDIKFRDLYDASFRDQFRFQLGRLYALVGDLNKARQVMMEIVNHPSNPNSVKWPSMTRNYLKNIPNLETAEMQLSLELSPQDKQTNPIINPTTVVDQASTSLFQGDPLDEILKTLQKMVSEPNLKTTSNAQCATLRNLDQPVTIRLYQTNDCASIYYLLGLVYEKKGDYTNARDLYWRVWKEFPESFYAIVARQKITEQQTLPLE